MQSTARSKALVKVIATACPSNTTVVVDILRVDTVSQTPVDKVPSPTPEQYLTHVELCRKVPLGQERQLEGWPSVQVLHEAEQLGTMPVIREREGQAARLAGQAVHVVPLQPRSTLWPISESLRA